jgi:hypothetical protein
LIGRPYRLGADGSGLEIDCIHLVYEVLRRMEIPAPLFNAGWYEASKWEVARDLLKWGARVAQPQYDGDVLLLRQERLAFAVTWQTGILYINRHLEKVAWTSAQSFTSQHCFRSRSRLFS